MGVFGCLPAFDSNLSQAVQDFKDVKPKNKCIEKLNTGLKEGPKAWVDFASDTRVQEFFNKDMRPAFLAEPEKKYPIMRVIDLYFWSQQAGKQK